MGPLVARLLSIPVIAGLLVAVCLPAASITAAPVPCMVTSYGGMDRCFAPDDVRIAAQRLPWLVVDPTTGVGRVAGLPLTQVDVSYGSGLIRAGQKLTPEAITYFYGRLPKGNGIPMPSPPRPKWMVVNENHGATFYWGTGVDRITGSSCSPKGGCEQWHGVWTVTSGIPARAMTIMAEGNESKAVVWAVGTAVRQSAGEK